MYNGTTLEDMKIDLFESLVNAGYSEQDAGKIVDLQSSVIKVYAELLDQNPSKISSFESD